MAETATSGKIGKTCPGIRENRKEKKTFQSAFQLQFAETLATGNSQLCLAQV